MGAARGFVTNRAAFFAPAISVLVAGLATGCAEGNQGIFVLTVTDRPGAIDDFQRLDITVSMIRIHRSGAPGGGDPDGQEAGGGWTQLAVPPERKHFDLVRLVDGNSSTLFRGTLAAGRYTQIRLTVDSAVGVLQDGRTVDVDVPARTLTVLRSFDVEPGGTTTFVFDVEVHRKGNGLYHLQPNAGKSQVQGPR